MRFNEPMKCSHPIEVMLRGIEEVQIFLLANPEEDSLTEAVTKYAERATRAEANMAEMEAKFEERFAVLSLTTHQP